MQYVELMPKSHFTEVNHINPDSGRSAAKLIDPHSSAELDELDPRLAERHV